MTSDDTSQTEDRSRDAHDWECVIGGKQWGSGGRNAKPVACGDCRIGTATAESRQAYGVLCILYRTRMESVYAKSMQGERLQVGYDNMAREIGRGLAGDCLEISTRLTRLTTLYGVRSREYSTKSTQLKKTTSPPTTRTRFNMRTREFADEKVWQLVRQWTRS